MPGSLSCGGSKNRRLRRADGAVDVAIPDRAATVGERVRHFPHKAKW